VSGSYICGVGALRRRIEGHGSLAAGGARKRGGGAWSDALAGLASNGPLLIFASALVLSTHAALVEIDLETCAPNILKCPRAEHAQSWSFLELPRPSGL
jgi:hypothetical protein